MRNLAEIDRKTESHFSRRIGTNLEKPPET
jgi:hypothetical protein